MDMTNPPRVARSRRLVRSTALAGALVSALLLGGPALAATPQAPAVTAAPAAVKITGDICYSDLPSQAHDTIRLIDAGGPFPYPKDGTVFSNRENVLPKQTSGYYHEYTVKTPGSPDRGARRIVTGQKTHEDYYTGDHYETFDLVDFGC